MKKIFFIFTVFFALSFISCKGEVEQEIQETQLEKDKSGEEKESEKEKPLVGTVKDVTAIIDVKSVSLFWTNPTDKDFSATFITFTPEEKNVAQPIVVQGKPGEESSTIINGLQKDIEYTFTLIALDKNLNKSESITIKATPGVPPDVIPPAEIKNIKTMIADKTVMLSWTNPDDNDFSSAEIIFTPKVEDVSQPIIIKGEPDKASSVKIGGLENGTEYTFTIVSVDNDLNKSKGIIVKATPEYTEDKIPPEEVSDFTIKEGHNRVILNWTNPNDYDFYAVEITSTFIQDGVSKKTIVTGSSSEKKSYIISNLSNGRECSFSIVTIDSNNNRSQGITKNATPRESKIRITASLPNDGYIVTLTNDKAPVQLDIWSTDEIIKVVYKKRDDNIKPYAESLLVDEKATLVTLDSHITTFKVTENGIYDIAVQNEERCESTYVEVKTIDKTPLVEVRNLSVSCDGEYVNLSWNESYYRDYPSKYESSLKNIKITYEFNDDEDDKDNGELNISPGEEKASIKIPIGKGESDVVNITVQAVDEVGNINQGCNVQQWCNNLINIPVTAENAEEKIKVMTESGRICVIGECNLSSIIKSLRYLQSNQPEIKVVLDLSKTIGLTSIYGFDGKVITIITKVIIPDSVTSIGFDGCTGLTNITIPDSVMRIGDSAFCGCTGLTSITIPDSVTSIGDSAFKGCTGLTSITIPNSVTSIGDSAFNGCTGLTSITIPDSVTRIAAFAGCSRLTSITIPDSVTSIGDSAFYGCSGLTNITIPDSVKSIGNNAFSYCTGLTEITIPNGVESIGDSAFKGCTGLTSITIPDSVISIGDNVFNDCKGLTGITIPDSVMSFGLYLFRGCSSLEEITIPFIDNVNRLFYFFYEESSSLKKITVTRELSDGCFSNYSFLPTIILSDNITRIPSSAFKGSRGLTSIIIPDSVTSIGDSAFKGCTGLTSITIPDSVTSIESFSFSGCSGLTSITIPNSVKSIGNNAFSYCTGLTEITILNGVESIENRAFYFCDGVTSIIIPDSVTRIGYEAFVGCDYANVIFNDTESNWYKTKDSNYIGGELIDLVSAQGTRPNGYSLSWGTAIYYLYRTK